jgi:hypothetical protein
MKAPEISRRGFLAGTAGLAGLAFSGYAAKEPKFAVARAVSAKAGAPVSKLGVGNPAAIRALQLTDLHFFCPPTTLERDKLTTEYLPGLIERAKPDILLVTGDLWHDNNDGTGREYMEFAIDKITSLGVPWLFEWGNHDQLDDYAAGHDFLSGAKHSLYAGGSTGGNYRVEITRPDGSTCFEFVCVNTSLDGADAHTAAYLEALAAERGGQARVPAMGVMHIPVKQYFEAWREGDPTGIRLEGVSHQREDGETLPAWKAACGLKSCIAGHDHCNNYSGTIDGITLFYGQSTGASGYGGDKLPKGAKLYIIDAASGAVETETHFPDGAVWRPEAGWRTEEIVEIPWDTHDKRKALEDLAKENKA